MRFDIRTCYKVKPYTCFCSKQINFEEHNQPLGVNIFFFNMELKHIKFLRGRLLMRNKIDRIILQRAAFD